MNLITALCSGQLSILSPYSIYCLVVGVNRALMNIINADVWVYSLHSHVLQHTCKNHKCSGHVTLVMYGQGRCKAHNTIIKFIKIWDNSFDI